MVPTKEMLDRLATLLATDTSSLAPAALAVHVHLIMAPFTPGPLTDFTALTEATFTGSTAKNAGVGAQQSFTDPASGLRIVQLLEPAGGWHWVASDATGLPQTIYGYCVTDNADAVTWGSALLPAPLAILASGNAIDLPYVRFSVSNAALT